MDSAAAPAAAAAATSSRPSPSPAAAVAPDTPPPPPLPPPPAAPVLALAAVGAGQRQRFTVELKPLETTIVSWKKLVKESSKGAGLEPEAAPVGADPAATDAAAAAGLSVTVQPVDGEPKDEVPPPNRFSAVIEKIERLYTGKESSDEEGLGDNPDDDQYDTEDSFIDDAELDEYFQVDKLATKHNGYFINRGKLEQVEASSSPIQAPKKRRRKDSTKMYSEKEQELIPSEPVNMGNMRIKAAARNAPLAGKKLSSPKITTPCDNVYEDGKQPKGNLNTSTGTYKKSSADFTINSENPSSVKISNDDALSVSLESKELAKHKTGVIPSRDISLKLKGTSELVDGTYKASRDKGVSSVVESQLKPKKLLNGDNNNEGCTKKQYRERNGVGEVPHLSSSGKASPLLAVQPSLARVKEGTIVRPKGSALERAIRDLQKIVGESRPPNLNVQEVDPSAQAIKRRLPLDIKQRLAKVARLSASQGKISENELMDRLMGILGHLVQRKTLKRHIKEMVESGLSAKQQKDGIMQQISKELHEMIGTQVSQMKSKVSEQQDGSADDFQNIISNDEKRALKGKFIMDKTLEDKICDLYDLYVEGMDEDKGPQSRKLYAQLAELWPNGYMDNFGIKDAIFRSKERKRVKHRKNKCIDEERIKRRSLAASSKVDASTPVGQVRTGLERSATDSAVQTPASHQKLTSNPSSATSHRTVDQASSIDYGHYQGSKPHDKGRVSSIISGSTAVEDGSKSLSEDVKKKLKKRKADPSMDDFYSLPHKLSTQQVKEKPHTNRQGDDLNLPPYPFQSLQLPVIPDLNPTI